MPGQGYRIKWVPVLAHPRVAVVFLLLHHRLAVGRLGGGSDPRNTLLLGAELRQQSVDQVLHNRRVRPQSAKVRSVRLLEVLDVERESSALKLKRKRHLRRVVVLFGLLVAVAERLVHNRREEHRVLGLLLRRGSPDMGDGVAQGRLVVCERVELVPAGVLGHGAHRPQRQERLLDVQREGRRRVDDEREPLVVAPALLGHLGERLQPGQQAVKQAGAQEARRAEERVVGRQPPTVRPVAGVVRLVTAHIVPKGGKGRAPARRGRDRNGAAAPENRDSIGSART